MSYLFVQVLARVHEVAHSDALSVLVELCNGPAGPLAAVDLNAPPPPPEDKKKKGTKKAKPKKVSYCLLTLHVYLQDSMPVDNLKFSTVHTVLQVSDRKLLLVQGKKAGKLEDGMAEAQAQAAGCIRLLSLSDLVKVDLMAAGAVRFLTPLLESKLNQARWNARQVRHLSVLCPQVAPTLL